MVRFVEFAIALVVLILILKPLWPMLTGKSIGSSQRSKLMKKLADARENLSEEELLDQITEINKIIEKKKKERENASN
jgi:hypothetical protein